MISSAPTQLVELCSEMAFDDTDTIPVPGQLPFRFASAGRIELDAQVRAE